MTTIERKIRAKLIGKGLIKPVPVVGNKQMGSMNAIRSRQAEMNRVLTTVVSYVSR